MTDIERRDLLEVIEDRYDKTSTVITTQMPTKTWHEALGDPTIADAICDRLVHNAHLLKLGGPSIRRKKALETQPQPRLTPSHSSLRSDRAQVLRNARSSPSGTSAQVDRNAQLGLLPKLSADELTDGLKRMQASHDATHFLRPAEIRALLRAALKHDAVTFKATRAEHAAGQEARHAPPPEDRAIRRVRAALGHALR